MVSKSEVENEIREIIVRTLMLEGVSSDELPKHEENFLDALGANSIDTLELIISVEERFGFNFSDEQLRPDMLHTLDNFVTCTYNCMSNASEPALSEGSQK